MLELNPYNGVDWTKQQKGMFHSHSLLRTINGTIYGSDGSISQETVIDNFHEKGYKLLAFTDHDDFYEVYTYSSVTTHPWEVFGRNPAELGMLAIEGKEPSNGHHYSSLFCDLGQWDENEDTGIAEIQNRGGLCVINHPGRYSYPLEWYTNLCMKYPDTIIGVEVYSCGDRYPNDRILWDKINAITIPQGKIVYGYSNDDMHIEAQRFRNYNYVLSPTIAETDVRSAMEQGKLYCSYESGGTGDALAPKITNISVDEENKTISISADSGTIKWITEETAQVGTGNTFNYSNFDKCFVRAEITNSYGVTCTQPFAIKPIKELVFENCKTMYNGKLTELRGHILKHGILREIKSIRRYY